MRKFALATLFGLSVFNGFLGYSGQILAREVQRVAVHDGIRLSVISQAACALQPWFYLLATAALVATVLGFAHNTLEKALIYTAFSFLVLDIAGLFLSLWGVHHVHFRL